MPLYKFADNDVFANTIVTYPQVNFLIYSGSLFYNDQPNISGAAAGNIKLVPNGNLSLYEYNINRATIPVADQTTFLNSNVLNTGLIHPFFVKDGSRIAFRTVTRNAYNTSSLGGIITGSYPMSASIYKEFYGVNTPRYVSAGIVPCTPASTAPAPPAPAGECASDGYQISAQAQTSHLYALRNILNYYTFISPHYAFSSSLINAPTGRSLDSGSQVGLISIPSIFYGSEIKRGSVKLSYYITGTLIGELRDRNVNGELIETYGPNSGSVAGVILYNEGFVILTGSYDLASGVKDYYTSSAGTDSPSWIMFGQPLSGTIVAPSSSFAIQFSGTTEVQSLSMFVTAPKGELNHSNNPSYRAYTTATLTETGSRGYVEYNEKEIKNIVSSSYNDPTGSFQKTTYISKVGIYDENRNLIAIAKVATPVKKTENKDFTLKLKLDI